MSPDSNSASPSAFARIDPIDYLRVVYRRRWLALAVFLTVVASVAVYTYRATPLYEGRVSILIDLEQPNVVNLPQVLNEGSDYQTQYEILRSRALAQRTVAALQLWKRPELDLSTESAAVDAVRGRLQVTPVRGTRVVQVRVRWPEPKLAAEIANAHARQYVEQSLDIRFRASKEASAWLEAQLAEERKRVEEADSALQAYRERNDAVALADGQNIVVQKLADMNAAVTKAKTARIEAEARYRELAAIENDREALEAFPAILSNGFIQQLKTNLVTLQREYAQQSQTLGDQHPTLIETRTAMQTTERRLDAEMARVRESVRNAYRTSLAEESSLTRALEEQKREALALDRKGIEYAALEREAESLRLVYQTLLQRAKQTSVSTELRTSNIRVIDAARPSSRPVYPRTGDNLLLALLMGTALALGSVFVEGLVSRIETPDHLTAQLSVPFFGLVPKLEKAEPVLLHENVPAVFVEAFRALRTSLVSSTAAQRSASVVISSATQGEGKTVVACNLAISLSQAQERVLLIDADLRRPKVHARFGQPLEPGLSDVLAGKAMIADVLRPTAVPGLTVLSAGTMALNAPELLGSANFAQLFEILQEHFTWIVVDSPPVLSVTDASIVARLATGTIFVVGSGMIRGRSARVAVGELQRAGGQVIGAVLNRADLKHHRFYFGVYARDDYDDYLDALGDTDGGRRVNAAASSVAGGAA